MFVQMTKDQFEEILPENWRLINEPRSNELVYDVPTKTKNLVVRIYSSIDKKDNVTRNVGADAVRVVFFDSLNNRPLGKGKRINRVEGKTTIGERLKERIDAFMSESGTMQIIDFEYVKAILTSPAVSRNKFAQSLFESLQKFKSLTPNQLAYVLGDKNPKGYDCFERTAKIHDPLFLERYLNNFEEDRNEDREEHSEEEREEFQESAEGVLDGRSGDGHGVVGDDIELRSTSNYPYYKYDFDYFNPVQSATYPYKGKDKNIVISANTSSGKTIASELLIDELFASDKTNKMVIYTCPMKSLSNERQMDWSERYPDKKITMLSGDTLTNQSVRKKQMEEASQSDIIITTFELLDSISRHYYDEKYFWLRKVGLLIMDEAHCLTMENRGNIAESALMKFTKINDDVRICFLSATMPNVIELSEWLSLLNKKETDTILCKWRPVPIEMEYIEYPIQYKLNGREDYHATHGHKEDMCVDIAMSKPDEKFLIFVHAKNTGRSLIAKLARAGEVAKFHSADLEYEERKDLEASFKDKEHGLRVMVSTSTTAIGSVAKGTLITLSNGTQVPVENLSAGSAILSCNQQGETEQDVVCGISQYTYPYEELEIELEDGTKITTSRDHPFYVVSHDGKETIIEAEELSIGDDLILLGQQ